MRFYTMDHRGGLNEALETRKLISKDSFNKLLKFYEFYCFDDRINSIRFIHRDIESEYPTWLLLEFTGYDFEELKNKLIEEIFKNGK